MSVRKQVWIEVSASFVQELQEAAKSQGMTVAAFSRVALRAAVRHPDIHAFYEVTIRPRAGSPIDDILGYLAAGKPLLRDFQQAGPIPLAKLHRIMRRALTEVQYARLRSVMFEGRELRDVASEEGMSKQAVHQAVKRAVEVLRRDPEFLVALCECFPESGVDATVLAKAMEKGASHETSKSR